MGEAKKYIRLCHFQKAIAVSTTSYYAIPCIFYCDINVGLVDSMEVMFHCRKNYSFDSHLQSSKLVCLILILDGSRRICYAHIVTCKVHNLMVMRKQHCIPPS